MLQLLASPSPSYSLQLLRRGYSTHYCCQGGAAATLTFHEYPRAALLLLLLRPGKILLPSRAARHNSLWPPPLLLALLARRGVFSSCHQVSMCTFPYQILYPFVLCPATVTGHLSRSLPHILCIPSQVI